MTTAKYAHFTEEANALDYLEKTISFIKNTGDNPLNWKWVMLAIHGALYSFMICALKGTTPDNVCIKTKSGTRLIDFREARKRCEDSGWMHISGFNKVLQLTDKQREALGRIHNEFRNYFVHYQPTCWSIELAGMPEIVAHGLDVLHFITLEMGCYYVHYETGDYKKIADLIIEGKRTLASMGTLRTESSADFLSHS